MGRPAGARSPFGRIGPDIQIEGQELPGPEVGERTLIVRDEIERADAPILILEDLSLHFEFAIAHPRKLALFPTTQGLLSPCLGTLPGLGDGVMQELERSPMLPDDGPEDVDDLEQYEAADDQAKQLQEHGRATLTQAQNPNPTRPSTGLVLDQCFNAPSERCIPSLPGSGEAVESDN